MCDKPMTMKDPEFPLYYKLGTFEKDVLDRICIAIVEELKVNESGNDVDILRLATAASALNALVNVMKANLVAEVRGLRLDGALQRLKPKPKLKSKG